ncbi:MAG TPA: alpha/beta hydrolase [Blastocatellia bacterium]|nr:alpha/beta hydrolase [Blastocatellia bacterium]
MKQLTRLFLLLLSINACADCLPIKVRNPEGNYIVPGTQGDIVYARVNGQELALDAYVQKRGDQRPAVIVIHGGGFTSGSRVSFIGQFLELLTSAGYNWFAIDYRKQGVSRYKESLADVRAALAFIRCHAKAFRIDPDRIALLGEDTGATLAALLAAEKPAGVKANVMIGGVYDFRSVQPYQNSADAETLAEVSPLNHLAPALPDTLMIHGSQDTEVPSTQATDYFIAFQQAGGNNIMLELVHAIHRPENWRPEQWRYKSFLIRWLNKRLKLEAADHEPYFSERLQKDILFSPKHGLRLDAYVPKGRGPFPAVIIAHGGGWEAGDKVTYVTPLFEPFAKAGLAWFSMDYRLTPEFRNADQLADVRAAIRFVRANAKRFNVDPKRIAILGESASGQMVAQLATELPQDVAAVVSFYGVYDFEARARAMTGELTSRSMPTRLFGITKLDDAAYETLRQYSPHFNVQKAMPPLLLICGTKDSLYAQHTAFLAQLKQVKARFDSFAVEGAPHGIENWEGHPEWMGYKQTLVNWLRVQLRR